MLKMNNLLELIARVIFIGVTFLSLFLIDLKLGSGLFVCLLHIICIFKGALITTYEKLSEQFLISDILVLTVSLIFMKSKKDGQDRLDVMLNECKEILKETSAFINKWENQQLISQLTYKPDPSMEFFAHHDRTNVREIPVYNTAITMGQPAEQYPPPTSANASGDCFYNESVLRIYTSGDIDGEWNFTNEDHFDESKI